VNSAEYSFIMGPGDSLGAALSILMGWAICVFRVVGFFKIVSKHFKIGPSKLTLFGIFEWVGLIGLIY
jgi:hypothetical protein